MSAVIFLVSLLASGLASSVVGTMAGQVIMQDFVDWRIPLWLRRLATMLPTILIVGWVADATKVLVTLLLFTGSPEVMGAFANSRMNIAVAIAGTAVVLALNVLLLVKL